MAICLIENEKGRLKIFHASNEKSVYAIGIDVSSGEATDSSAMIVLDKELNHCATWYGKEHPDIVGSISCRLGKYYNNALLAPEITGGHGFSTLNAIKKLGYGNIYTRTVHEERSEKLTKKLGYDTNRKTKIAMIDKFVAAFRDKHILINDIDLLIEMSTINIEEDGDININGKDRFAAACIALVAIEQAIGDKFAAVVPGQKIPKTFQERIKMHERKIRNGIE